jgi:cytochrome P450
MILKLSKLISLIISLTHCVLPNVEDLTDEMFTILTAAAETTGHTMTMTTYYALSNPVIYRTLVSELKVAFPDKKTNLDYLALEKLP